MNDAATKKLTIAQLVREIEDRKGYRINLATAHRWVIKGCRGAKLAAERVGVRYLTTWQDYERFATAVAAGPAVVEPTTPTRKRNRVADAGRILEAAGIRRPEPEPV